MKLSETGFIGTFMTGFTSSFQQKTFVTAFALTCFLSLCGVVLVAGGMLPDNTAWTASVIIILTAVTTFLSEMRTGNVLRNVMLFFVIVSSGFAIEYVGVTTGFPFGGYAYTDTLSFMIYGVPVAIACAWYSTIMNTYRLAQWLQGHGSPVQVAVTAGILTLALDIALEPMASSVNNYWVWETVSVPLQNYVSWFALGFLGVLCVSLSEADQSAVRPMQLWRVSGVLFGLQLFLFCVTNGVNGFLLPTAVSIMIVAIEFGVRKRMNSIVLHERLAQK